MKLRIEHTTTYTYQGTDYALHQVRLRPNDCTSQTVLSWGLQIEGGKAEVAFTDQHGNKVDLVSIEPDVKRFTLTCSGEVETYDTGGVLPLTRTAPPLWLYRRFTHLTTAEKGVRALLSGLGRSPELGLETLHALMGLVADTVAYDTGGTGTKTTAEEALQLGHGVCQDHAHVFISAARLLGFPARYVGGYMMMTERIDQDAGHAWAEAFVDGLGWVGFDPANRISPDERYIRLATGLDYGEAAPVSGVMYGGGGDTLDVSVQVQQQ